MIPPDSLDEQPVSIIRWVAIFLLAVALAITAGFWSVRTANDRTESQGRDSAEAACQVQASWSSAFVDVLNRLTAARILPESATAQEKVFQAAQNEEAAEYRRTTLAKLRALECAEVGDGRVVEVAVPALPPALVGATGPGGQQGAIGLTGAQGPPGKDGADGAPGLTGAPGVDGVDGVDGIDGVDGADGAPGPVGPVGPVGPQGEVGPPGPEASTTTTTTEPPTTTTTPPPEEET